MAYFCRDTHFEVLAAGCPIVVYFNARESVRSISSPDDDRDQSCIIPAGAASRQWGLGIIAGWDMRMSITR